MNAEDFYEEFKAALKHLGTEWGDKESVQVFILGDYFVMSRGKLRVGLSIARKQKRKKVKK